MEREMIGMSIYMIIMLEISPNWRICNIQVVYKRVRRHFGGMNNEEA
ncbi:MAG: hypothetical protein DDT23_00711 [candidate division WS2 bacterium]|nr:hypothetical protein [Candidatus Lithacetigena glycinireducens]